MRQRCIPQEQLDHLGLMLMDLFCFWVSFRRAMLLNCYFSSKIVYTFNYHLSIGCTMIRSDIQCAAGPVQLCAGQMSGVEAAIHPMRTMFLMIILRECCWWMQLMHSVHFIDKWHYITSSTYVLLSSPLVNTYRHPAPLNSNGDILHSNEGTIP